MPFTDTEICVGPDPVSIGVALVLLLGAAIKLYPGWQYRSARQQDVFKPLVCSGQYTGSRHPPVERTYDGASARCPVCGHTLID